MKEFLKTYTYTGTEVERKSKIGSSVASAISRELRLQFLQLV